MRKQDCETQEVFECDCGTEHILISYDKTEGLPNGWPPEDRFIYMTWWSTDGRVWSWGLWSRLRLCWNILVRGQGWMGEVILSAYGARRLSNTLLRAVDDLWPEWKLP